MTVSRAGEEEGPSATAGTAELWPSESLLVYLDPCLFSPSGVSTTGRPIHTPPRHLSAATRLGDLQGPVFQSPLYNLVSFQRLHSTL